MLMCNECFPGVLVSLKIHILEKIKYFIALTVVEMMSRKWNLWKDIDFFKGSINIYLIQL